MDKLMREEFEKWAATTDPKTGHKNGNVIYYAHQYELWQAAWKAALEHQHKQSLQEPIHCRTTEGMPCTVRLEEGWSGEFKDGILHVTPTKT